MNSLTHWTCLKGNSDDAHKVSDIKPSSCLKYREEPKRSDGTCEVLELGRGGSKP